MSLHLKRKDGAALTLEARGSGDAWEIGDGNESRAVQVLEHDGARLVFVLDGVVHRAHTRVTAREVRVLLQGRESVFSRQEPSAAAGSHGAELHEPVLRSPVPGRVLQVRVAAGAHVEAGDVLVVIEAMKMETPVVAPADGTVGEVHVAEGELVDQDQALITCVY